MRLITLTLLLLTTLLAGCSTTKDPATAAANKLRSERTGKNATKVDISQGTDLTAFIRRLPGVTVRGDGPSATIRVRGNNPFISSADPLFVVDGVILGNNYDQLYSAVDVMQVDRVRVLKDIGDLSMYGVQGANGVIVVELKK